MLRGEQEFGFEEQVGISRNFLARGYDKAVRSILYIDLCLSLTMATPLGYKKNSSFKIGIYLSGRKVTHLLGLPEKALSVLKFLKL